MSEVKYFEREYNYLQEAGEEFAKKHQAQGGMLRLSEKQRKDPFVERLFEAFAFLAGRIHERLDDDMPEFTGGLLEQLFPHFLKPFPACAIMEANPMVSTLSKPVTVVRGSEIRTPTGKYKVKYRVTASALDTARSVEKIEPAEFIFRATRDLLVRPMRMKKVQIAEEADGTTSLIIQINPDRGIDFDTLELKTLSLYLHGSYRLKYTLLLYLTKYTTAMEIRALGEKSTDYTDIKTFKIGTPELSPDLEYDGNDLAILPGAKQTFNGYRLLQEYFAFPERFFFLDVVGLDAYEASPDGNPFEIKFKFSRKLSSEIKPTVKDILINCVPIVNLFDRPTEEVSVNQRLPEYYIVPDMDRRKSKEIYSIRNITGISENRLNEYTYIPVTSHDILDISDPDYEYKRFYSTVYRPVEGDMAEHNVRLFGPSIEEDVFPKDTLSINATMSNGDLPAEYLEAKSIREPVNFPEGIEAYNLTVPTKVLQVPERKNYLWTLISHLSMSYTTLADTERLKSVLSLHNWSTSHTNPNKKKIQEGIIKVHPPNTRYIYRQRGLIRGIEFKMDIDASKFEHGEGDIFLFGLVLRKFLAQYITINSFVILTMHEIDSDKVHTWTPNLGKILPV